MIPTIILTGFLGAGKTTLLNRLIPYYQSRRTVLLINEFGQVGIDGELLVQGNYQKIELNKGSLFCICVRTDFISEVQRIATELQPELLIIEATGLADTSEMEKMLALPTLRDFIDLQVCVCVVDCQNFLKIHEFLHAPAAQVRHADVVLINKIDLVATTQVTRIIAAVREIAPTVPVIQTSFSAFPLETLATIRRPASHAAGTPGDGRPDPVTSLTLEGIGMFSAAAFAEFRALIPRQALRVKGFVSVDGQAYQLDATTDQWNMQPTTLVPPQTNRLIVIGQALDFAAIQASFYKGCTT